MLAAVFELSASDLAIAMSRTSIVALVLFAAALGYLLQPRAAGDAQNAGDVLTGDLAVSEDRFGFGKTDHFGAERT